MSFQKTAGVAAALMLSGSYTAMAATLATFNTNVGTPVPMELVGNANVAVGNTATNGGTTANQKIEIVPVATGNLSGASTLITFTMSQGTFGKAVSGADLVGTGCATATFGVSSGGTVGSNTVTFSALNSKTCSKLTWAVPNLKGLSNGSPVNVSATMKLEAGGAPVDNGITNGPLPYITFLDVNTGKANSVASTINLATGGKVTKNGTPQQFATGLLVDSVATTAFKLDLSAAIANMAALDPAATGSIVFTGIPPAVKTSGITLTTAGGGHACTSMAYTQGAGTFTCAMDATNYALYAGSTGSVFTFEVDQSTVLASSTINAKLTTTYGAANSIGSEVKYDGAGATLGTDACAAEFGSMMGKKTTNALTTIRLSNTSASAGKVYVTATDDKGTHSGVTQITRTNGGASAAAVLNASDQLPAGATVELLGTDLETATLNFDSWSGTTRGRVRVYVEAAGGGSLGGGTAVAGGNSTASSCKAEAWMCINGTCSIVNQTGNGTDGVAPIAQKN